MEESLLLAAAAAIAFGLLQKLRAWNLRTTGGGAAHASCRAVIADAASEGLLAIGLGALGLGAVCRMLPGHPEGPAALALGLGLGAVASRMRADQKRDSVTVRAMVLAADLLGSFTAAALTLAEDWGGKDAQAYILALTAAGALTSIASAALTNRAARTEDGDPLAANLGSWTGALLLTIAALPLSGLLEDNLPAFGAAVCGVMAGLLVIRPAAKDSLRRLRSAAVLAGTALGAWILCGAFGVALAAVGMTAGAAPVTAVETLALPSHPERFLPAFRAGHWAMTSTLPPHPERLFPAPGAGRRAETPALPSQPEEGSLSAPGREFTTTAATLSLLTPAGCQRPCHRL